MLHNITIMFILRGLLPFEAADFDLLPDSVICVRRKTEGTNDIGALQIKIQVSKMKLMPE